MYFLKMDLSALSNFEELSVFDRLECLRFQAQELSDKLSTIVKRVPEHCKEELESFQKNLGRLVDSWEHFFQDLNLKYEQEQTQVFGLKKQLFLNNQKSKKKLSEVQKLLTQKKTKLKSKEKEFHSSLSKIQQMFKQNLNDMEKSLKGQKAKLSQVESNCISELEQVDQEMQEVITTPVHPHNKKLARKDLYLMPCQVTNPVPKLEISKVDSFEDLLGMEDQSIDRISMEKNEGGWESCFETEEDSQEPGVDQIKDAVKVLDQAKLLQGNQVLQKLGEIANCQDEENLELMLQLLNIQMNRSAKKSSKPNSSRQFESTPKKSLEFDNPDFNRTLLSPGYRPSRPKFENSCQDVKIDDLLKVSSIVDELGIKNLTDKAIQEDELSTPHRTPSFDYESTTPGS